MGARIRLSVRRLNLFPGNDNVAHWSSCYSISYHYKMDQTLHSDPFVYRIKDPFRYEFRYLSILEREPFVWSIENGVHKRAINIFFLL